MVKFYVLVSSNRFALKRHENTIPKEDMVIVINTKDQLFEQDAVEYCTSNGIEHYVTESDGTPSTGKNSLLDLFESSQNDYAVMVDGDDIITDYGVSYYKQLAASTNTPDVVALKNQVGFNIGLIHYSSSNPGFETDKHGDVNPDSVHPRKWYPFKQKNVLEDCVESLPVGSTQRTWAEYCLKYIGSNETHHRVTFISKKAASMYRFNELVIGEDTCMYLDYYDAHKRGALNLVFHNEEENPTYQYDSRVGGIVEKKNAESRQKGEMPDWLGKLVDKYKEYEQLGKLWATGS